MRPSEGREARREDEGENPGAAQAPAALPAAELGRATPLAAPPAGEARGRRAYRSPLLRCHGRLAEVTRFGGSEIVDSGNGLGTQF